MSNHITASVEFYFKGNRISSSIELDLDQHMQSTGKLPDLYPLLARAAELDIYSYEYEMMQAESILFSNARGLASAYVNDGSFDFKAFETSWSETQLLEKLQLIASENLSIDDLDQQAGLKAALLQAYQLGEKTALKKI